MAASLVGASLLTKSGLKPTSELFAGKKFIAFYFSAHWCGPCRKFTPLLSVLYEDRVNPDEVEVVFVSSDSDIDGFNEYYEEMPWLSVPFEDEETREKLSAHFEVEGIPTLAVVDAATGATVTKDGRAVVTSKKKLDGVF